MLAGMLGNSPQCITTPESQFKTIIAAKICRNEIRNDHDSIQASLKSNFRFSLWNLQPELEGKTFYSNEDNLLPQILLQYVEHYAIKQGKESFRTWVDHTPNNINKVSLLSRQYPDALFIHMVRDGRGTFSSVKPLDWGPNTAMQGAIWWAYRTASGLGAEQAFSSRLIRVRFEDLIHSPEKELKRICDFAGLSFQSSMLSSNGFAVPGYTKSQHRLIGDMPDKSAGENWKHRLTARELEVFEYFSGDLLEYLGYEAQYGMRAKPPSRLEIWQDVLQGQILRGASNRMRRYLRIKRARAGL